MASYTIKITLNDIEPAIWRRIKIPASGTFNDLHNAIQGAMGWQWCHLWEFQKGDKTLLRPILDDEDWDTAGGRYIVINALEEPLENHLKAGLKLVYLYDMGDDWSHTVEVEAVSPEDIDLPVCLEGERACPPEDCGGTPGYERLLKTLAKKKKSTQDKDLINWLEEIASGWSPEKFDPQAATEAMRNSPEME